MMVFCICVNDTAPSIYKYWPHLVGKLLVMNFYIIMWLSLWLPCLYCGCLVSILWS